MRTMGIYQHLGCEAFCHYTKEMRSYISSKYPKPLFGAFGQTEKTGFKVFGSFQPGLPRKVPQSP